MATIEDFMKLDLRIGTIFESEVLVIGGVPEEGDVILLRPDEPVKNGTPIA